MTQPTREQILQNIRAKTGLDLAGKDVNAALRDATMSQNIEKSRQQAPASRVIVTSPQQAKAAVDAITKREYAVQQREAEIAVREKAIAGNPPVNHYERLMTPEALAAARVGRRGGKHVKELVKDEDQRIDAEVERAAERQRVESDPQTQELRAEAARLVTLARNTGDQSLIDAATDAEAFSYDSREAAVAIGRERAADVKSRIYSFWEADLAAKRQVTQAAVEAQVLTEQNLGQPPKE